METNDQNDEQSLLENFHSAKHDFNNLLHNVLNAIDLLKEKAPENSSTKSLIKQIENNTILASRLLDQVVPDKVSVPIKKTALNLENLIVETLKLVTNEAVKISLNIAAGEYFVLGNSIEIQRVILNLISNAIEAQKDNLRIDIKLEKIINSANENFIVLNIKDNGNGISDRNTLNIFRRGFSTKFIRANKGLGLSIVKNIIERHSGYIELSSEIDKGTNFKIYLPSFNLQLDSTILESKKVLIAEDDDFQREVLSDLLTSMKINVFSASNGIEALDLFFLQKPDLLFIDDKMPGMSGIECINKIREDNLETGIVLVTGSTDKNTLINGKQFKVLNKPYSFDEIKQLLSELL